MARPRKQKLDYYPFDVDYYNDFKIIELLDEYGPLGDTIYRCLINMVYSEGYFLEIEPKRLAMGVTRVIGNKWVKKDKVLQVVQFCADIGLFDKNLLLQNVITSAGLQRRYSNVTVRNKVNKDRFWLLDGNGAPLLNAPKTEVNATETEVNVTETRVNTTEMQQRKVNESKVNKNKVKEPKHKFGEFDHVRLTDAEKNRLIEEYGQELFNQFIKKLDEYIEQTGKKYKNHNLAIRNWVIKAVKEDSGTNYKVDKFNNFEQRDYDFIELEQQLLARRE